jgi:hypothetical protein
MTDRWIDGSNEYKILAMKNNSIGLFQNKNVFKLSSLTQFINVKYTTQGLIFLSPTRSFHIIEGVIGSNRKE